MRNLLILSLASLPILAQSPATSFVRTVYPVLTQAGCAACHNSNGVASATRLHFPEPAATADEIDAFGKSLVMLIDRETPANSLLLQKPTKRIAHGGGERIKPGSPEEATLVSWIGVLSKLSGAELSAARRYRAAAIGVAAPPPVLRRLTHSQYNHTVRDLLGDTTNPADQFPPDDFVDGFKNQYGAQNLPPLLEEAYGEAAERLAANAFRGGDVHRLVLCTPSTACREIFVKSFGKKAFRRPLTATETRRYVGLFSKERDFLKAAQLVVEAMLQSTNFLFRLDASPSPELKPYAAANRLSYTLWDTMPDEALMNSAARGELSTEQGLTRVTERILNDPRSREALNEFVSQWLRFDRMLTATRDRRRYPGFNRETAVAMTQEAQIFLSDLVWKDRNFMEAFTANYGFVNAELAPIYGVPMPAHEFDRVDFPAGSERGGLLGQSLFLSLTSKPEDASLTARGLFVREQFLCQHVPPPPAGVNTNLAPSSEANPQTNRMRMSAHVTDPSCAACHNLIDPIGWSLEKFDAIGMRREEFKLTFAAVTHGGGGNRRAPGKTVMLPLDTKGTIAGIANAEVSSPRELGMVLAASPQCQECVVKQFFRYAAGRMETAADQPLLDRVYRDFKSSDFRFKQLMISMIRSREFPGDERSIRAAGNH